MRRPILPVVVALAGAWAYAAAGAATDYSASVINLTVTYQGWNEFRPWAKRNPDRRVANAVVVGREALLTTAEMLRNATMIEAQRRGGAPCDQVRVVHVDENVNLALVAPECPGFADDLRPVKIADAAPTEGALATVRWKNGDLEVSPSRVSRVEVQETAFSSLAHPFLFAATDLEGGGWAEPVFANDQLVGLGASQDERTLRIIPADVIQSYLKFARAAGPPRRFASLGVSWQSGEDPALAAFLGLKDAPRGVVITSVPLGASACGALRPRDILLSLDGHAIEASGFYNHPRYGRLRFTYIPADGHVAGDVIPAQVLRGGQVVDVKITLRPEDAAIDLIPESRAGEPPFVIAGGLILRELDRPYLRAWGQDWSKKGPLRLLKLDATEGTDQKVARRRILILASVLPAPFNLGYQGLDDLVIAAINGRPVDTVSSAIEALQHPVGGFQRITTEAGSSPAEIVLDAENFEAATQKILETYRIPQRMRPTPPLPDLGPPCEGVSAP